MVFKLNQDRRTFLKGGGKLLALPMLEAFLPREILAQGKAPLRFTVSYFPSGLPYNADPNRWVTGRTSGPLPQTLPFFLEPFAPHRDIVTVMTGLSNNNARNSHPAFPGCGHKRASSTFLNPIFDGPSADQVIAAGMRTPLASLVVGTENATDIHEGHMSFSARDKTVTRETNLITIFQRIVSGLPAGMGAPQPPVGNAPATVNSEVAILDFVLEDGKRLRRDLGISDRERLDAYFDAVADAQKALARASDPSQSPAPVGGQCTMPVTPAADVALEHKVKILYDLILLALQCDRTRVVSFQQQAEAAPTALTFLGIPSKHHGVTHYGKNPSGIAGFVKISRWHMEQFAYFVGRLKATKDVDGSPLSDNIFAMLGSGMYDGDHHQSVNLPIVVAGKAGGKLAGGKHLAFTPTSTPIGNLYMALFQMFGAPRAKFGDSNGTLNIS